MCFQNFLVRQNDVNGIGQGDLDCSDLTQVRRLRTEHLGYPDHRD
jgi:hypothetical protein